MARRDSDASISQNIEIEKMNKEEQRHEQQTDAKFKMFFASLVFAILAFMGAHPLNTNLLALKISETSALFLLLITGIVLLIRIVTFHNKPSFVLKIISKFNNMHGYWITFILGMLLIVINRSVLMFIG